MSKRKARVAPACRAKCDAGLGLLMGRGCKVLVLCGQAGGAIEYGDRDGVVGNLELVADLGKAIQGIATQLAADLKAID